MNYYSRTLGLVSGVMGLMPTVLLAIAAYVLSSLAIYTIARRRGLRKPWLAWIPVVGSYLVGSLSDQYRYLVRREDRSKRKLLLVLAILRAALLAAVLGMGVSVAVRVIFGFPGNLGMAYLFRAAAAPLMRILWLCLPLCAASIAYVVIRYMALYDIYRSLDPANCVLYLVLSILFRITEPFFLFFNRGKDGGMPPRKRPAAQQPPEDGEPAVDSGQPQQSPETSENGVQPPQRIEAPEDVSQSRQSTEDGSQPQQPPEEPETPEEN